jgi:hypothetical protein
LLLAAEFTTSTLGIGTLLMLTSFAQSVPDVMVDASVTERIKVREGVIRLGACTASVARHISKFFPAAAFVLAPIPIHPSLHVRSISSLSRTRPTHWRSAYAGVPRAGH